MTTWDDTHQTAADPDNPSANEEITASEWNTMVREIKSGRYADWVVYKDSGGTWHAEGPDGATETSGTDPATVLQHAADQSEGNSIHLADSVESSEALSSTVVISKSFIGPGVRNQAHIYVGAADPGLRFEGEGTYERMWLRGQGNANDLVVFRDCGRGTVIRDIQCFNTDGNAVHFQGVQQALVHGLTFGQCGNPTNDTGELRLDNSPTDGLESNATNIYGIHSHGGGDPQGSLIQMRASNHTDNDHPRNIRINGINLENGPSDAIPVVEVAGRNNHFENVRMQGLDDTSAAFQLQAPRARDCTFSNLSIIGGDATVPTHGFSNAGSSAASSQSGVDWAPIVNNALIDVPGSAVFLDSFNQTGTPLYVSNLWNPANNSGGDALIDVSGSQDTTPGVLLSTIDAGGASISIQGTRLSVSGVRNTTWTSQSANFGPRLVADDGSFGPAEFTGSTSGGAGLAEVSFSGDFELKDGALTAFCDRGTGTVVQGASLDDTSGNGDLDTARAHVVNVSDGTDAADGVTVNFVVHPRAF